MTIEQALKVYLDAYTNLAAIVGDRIYIGDLPQDYELPAVTFFLVAGSEWHSQGANPGVSDPLYQFSCWAHTPLETVSIANQIKTALRDFSGVMGGESGVTVQATFLSAEVDLGRDPDVTDVYHRAVDFEIVYQ